jgi:hypothetical protein
LRCLAGAWRRLMYVSKSVTGATVVGVRGHLLAVEAHVGRGLPSGARRFVYAEMPGFVCLGSPPTSGRRPAFVPHSSRGRQRNDAK